MIGISIKCFHLDAENQAQKFRISLYISDTVPITGLNLRPRGGRQKRPKYLCLMKCLPPDERSYWGRGLPPLDLVTARGMALVCGLGNPVGD